MMKKTTDDGWVLSNEKLYISLRGCTMEKGKKNILKIGETDIIKWHLKPEELTISLLSAILPSLPSFSCVSVFTQKKVNDKPVLDVGLSLLVNVWLRAASEQMGFNSLKNSLQQALNGVLSGAPEQK